MRLTKKKQDVLKMFSRENAEYVCKEVGGYPIDAYSFSHLTGRDIRSVRRTLEALVRDGFLVREKSNGYYEASTGRTINRQGVAYDLPKEKRGGRPDRDFIEAERKAAQEKAINKFLHAQ